MALGYFPGCCEHAKVVTIQKKPKSVSVNKYRSIFLLKVSDKFLERIINDRVQQHMEENNVFQDEQFGFRRHQGTQQAIAVTYETIA